MKKFWYRVFVIALIPIYVIVKIFSRVFQWVEPFAQEISELIEMCINNMEEFWREIFKRNDNKQKKQ